MTEAVLIYIRKFSKLCLWNKVDFLSTQSNNNFIKYVQVHEFRGDVTINLCRLDLRYIIIVMIIMLIN